MKILAAASLAATLLFAGAASASQVYLVEAWTQGPIAGANNLADPAHLPGGPTTATFDWTGDINWSDKSAQSAPSACGIAANFREDDGLKASNFSSGVGLTEAQFLASSLTIAGDRYTTFFRISGSYFSPVAINSSFSHDDGATVYVDGVYAGGSAGETTVVSSPYTLAAGSHNLAVYYVAGNGTPSVFNFSSPAAVPEPSTWGLMILGFGGLGGVLRNNRRRQAALA